MSEKYYMGNPLLKRTNTPTEFSQEQLIELARCAADPVYFAKKYIKIVNIDDGLVQFDMWPFQEKMLRTFHENRFSICKLPRQCGKSLALDTKIPTPDGWTTMGEVKVGDKVLSPDGKSVTVLTKTDPMYNHKCYKLYFDTGEEIVADAGHLWEVTKNYYGRKLKKEVLTTQQIADLYKKKNDEKSVREKYFINITKPVECFTKKELSIDPYLLGVWLGDGYSADSRIISHKDDFEFYKTKIDIGYKAESFNCYRFNVNHLHKKLRELNLLKNKHIPQEYLRSTYDDRLELLRGLMDTDGSLRRKARTFEFYQKNYNLILQVVELVSSLGIKPKVWVKKIKESLYYTVAFNTDEIVFNLPRKKELIYKTKEIGERAKRIYIQKIEEVESVPVACISVDSEDKLFLCGNSFIPTHNSTTAVSFLLHYAIFNDNVSIAILANKASTAKDLLGRLQVSFENLPDWMQQGIKSWNKTSLELENGSKIITASTSASSVRGGSYNVIFLDEFAFVPNTVAINFMNSVYPTISSGKDSKVIVVSTPNGLNHFYKMWDEAAKKENDYVPIEIQWNHVPGRNDEWKKKTIANLGSEKAGYKNLNVLSLVHRIL
jgi:intein/homing endonuclease